MIIDTIAIILIIIMNNIFMRLVIIIKSQHQFCQCHVSHSLSLSACLSGSLFCSFPETTLAGGGLWDDLGSRAFVYWPDLSRLSMRDPRGRERRAAMRPRQRQLYYLNHIPINILVCVIIRKFYHNICDVGNCEGKGWEHHCQQMWGLDHSLSFRWNTSVHESCNTVN